MTYSLNFKLALLALLTYFICCIAQITQAANLKTKFGEISIEDLSDWNIKKNPVRALEGNWDFYWKQLLTPETFKKIDMGKTHTVLQPIQIPIPGLWNELKLPENSQPNQLHAIGWGTYRKKIILPNLHQNIAFKVPNIVTAYKLWVNGKLRVKGGVVAADKSKARDSVGVQSFTIKVLPNANELDIVLQVSNFSYRHGGPWKAIEIGDAESINRSIMVDKLLDSVMISCLLFIAFYHFCLYFFRYKSIPALLFGIACICIAIKTLILGNGSLINFILGDIDGELARRIELTALYMFIIVFSSFLWTLFPKDFSLRALKVIALIYSALIIVTLTTPMIIFSKTVPLFQLMLIPLVVIIIKGLIQATIKRRDSIIIISFGIYFLSAGAIIDTLYYNGFRLFDFPVAQLGLFIMALTQSVALAKRFSNAYNQVEISESNIKNLNVMLLEKSELLEQHNLKLDQLVDEKTRDLRHKSTELEKKSNELQIKSDKLQQVDAMKTQFFTNITHEIRTPLTLNIGTIEHVMEQNPNLDEKIQGQLNQAAMNGKRLLFLINQILDINRYAVQEEVLQTQTHDLNQFIEWIAERFKPLAIQKEIRFKVSHPEIASAVEFDCSKMERILVNLLSNSFKFTHLKDEIHLEIHQYDDYVVLNVLDSGIGIPKKQLPFIFDRFYSQNKKQQLEYASTGIGLAIVKSLVELHGGTIQASNREPKGTCFSLQFPISEKPMVALNHQDGFYSEEFIKMNQPSSTDGATLENNAEIEDLPANGQKSILIIDDNAELREFLKLIFNEHYLVHEAENGKEGLDKANRYYPDLIICDYMMPVMDGLEFVKQCKSDPETSFIPIFLLTASGTETSRAKSFELGVDDYLEKPFDVKEFKSKIKNLLATQEKLREYVLANLSGKAPLTPKLVECSDPFIESVRDYIIKNVETDINVEALASHFNTNRARLNQLVKKETNLTPQHFIKDIRLTLAAEQLTLSNEPVSTIAYSLGFNHLSYFTRSFKAKYHKTPIQYRSGQSALDSQDI